MDHQYVNQTPWNYFQIMSREKGFFRLNGKKQMYQFIKNENNLYPLTYEREIWDYKKANIDLIQQAIHEFNWERAIHRKKINEKVSILNNTIYNVLSNFICHKTITCDDKKQAWLHKNIINLIKNKNILYRSHTAN